MLDSLAKKVAPQHTAVLVVDMQNEFVEAGGLRGREGTWNADICEALAPVEGDMIVQKRRYCAFEGTGLDLMLRSKGIRTVVVTGMATDICVESTVRSAFVKDYYVVLTSGGVGPTRTSSRP